MVTVYQAINLINTAIDHRTYKIVLEAVHNEHFSVQDLNDNDIAAILINNFANSPNREIPWRIHEDMSLEDEDYVVDSIVARFRNNSFFMQEIERINAERVNLISEVHELNSGVLGVEEETILCLLINVAQESFDPVLDWVVNQCFPNHLANMDLIRWLLKIIFTSEEVITILTDVSDELVDSILDEIYACLDLLSDDHSIAKILRGLSTEANFIEYDSFVSELFPQVHSEGNKNFSSVALEIIGLVEFSNYAKFFAGDYKILF